MQHFLLFLNFSQTLVAVLLVCFCYPYKSLIYRNKSKPKICRNSIVKKENVDSTFFVWPDNVGIADPCIFHPSFIQPSLAFSYFLLWFQVASVSWSSWSSIFWHCISAVLCNSSKRHTSKTKATMSNLLGCQEKF